MKPETLLAALLLIACAPKPKAPAPHLIPAPAIEKVNGESADVAAGRGHTLDEMGFQPRVTAVEFSPIQFDLGKAAIRRDQAELIAAIATDAQWSRACTVTGHACPLGGEAYNETLGRARAEAVVQALRTCGVRTGLQVVSRGEAEPVTRERKEYWRNRRVVVECEE